MDNSAAAEVLERIALANLSDPATDDLTVPLAIELTEVQHQRVALVKALEQIEGLFDPPTGIWGASPFTAIERIRQIARAALATVRSDCGGATDAT